MGGSGLESNANTPAAVSARLGTPLGSESSGASCAGEYPRPSSTALAFGASARTVYQASREVDRRYRASRTADEHSGLHPVNQYRKLLALGLGQVAAAAAALADELYESATLYWFEAQEVLADQHCDLGGSEQLQHRHPLQPRNATHATTYRSANQPENHQPSVSGSHGTASRTNSPLLGLGGEQKGERESDDLGLASTKRSEVTLRLRSRPFAARISVSLRPGNAAVDRPENHRQP